MRVWSAVEGQAMVEYGGVLLLITLVMAALSMSGIGSQIAQGTECLVGHALSGAWACHTTSSGRGQQDGSPASAAPASPTTLDAASIQCVPPRVCPLPTDPGPPKSRPQRAGPHAPEYASTSGGNQSCPPGYDFHYDPGNGYPYCIDEDYDPSPATAAQAPPPLACPAGQTCIGPNPEGGCHGTTCSGLWWQQEAWTKCIVENGGDVTACPARPVQPVVGPTDPSNPNGPQQLFPYGQQQEQDYDRDYQQALASIVGAGGIPWPSLNDVERAKDESLAQVRANAQVNNRSARARYAEEAGSESSGTEGRSEVGEGDGNAGDGE